MSHIYPVALKFIPVVLLILLGSLIRRKSILKPETIQDIKKIIVNFSLPSLLLMTFAQTHLESKYICIFCAVFLLCTVMLGVGAAIKHVFKINNAYFPVLFSGFETGMLGYALYTAIYGAANTYKLAIIDLGQVTFVFFVLVSYLQSCNGQAASPRRLILDFLRSPVILSILVGVLLSSTGMFAVVQGSSVTHSITDTLNLLGNLTEPLICIVIGFELDIRLHNLAGPFFTALARLLLLLLAAFIIDTLLFRPLLHLDKSFEVALYALFLLPPPFVIPIYIDGKREREKQYVLSVISIHIILTLIAFAVLASVA